MVSACGTAWAICSKAVLDGAPPTVVYDVGDAEFTVLEQDRAPEQTDAPICLDCLLDLSPGLGRGLDVAHEHGVAYRVDGEWCCQPRQEPRKDATPARECERARA